MTVYSLGIFIVALLQAEVSGVLRIATVLQGSSGVDHGCGCGVSATFGTPSCWWLNGSQAALCATVQSVGAPPNI
jgi:hypothetical protein